MALQVDVTFLYTIGKGTFDLTMKDLISDSPYNTYKNKGLPPTPIGSPSLDSLLAAAVRPKAIICIFLPTGTASRISARRTPAKWRIKQNISRTDT